MYFFCYERVIDVNSDQDRWKKSASGRCFCKDCNVEGFVDETEVGKGDLLFQRGFIIATKT